MSEEKTFYVATSIPYVNDVPHLGHAMEFVLADILARYHAQLGEKVFFSVGTDEHGGKVKEKAEELGVDVAKYTEKVSKAFKDLTVALDVDYSKFIRTSDPDHEARAAQIWKNLGKDIYEDEYVGLYDQRQEAFLTDAEAKDIKENDPERFKTLKKLEEKNYFFKLSRHNETIKAAVKSGELRIVPNTKRNEFLSLLESGLEDVSISRPKDKLDWGIEVPGDDKQVMYVWFEALMNYITTLGYPEGADYKKFWPGNVHVIGKDILRFHAGIWPGMLLSLGESMPKEIYVHGFINVDGAKMSKSVGNVVSPLDIVDAYGSEAFRYYIARHIPSTGDGDFSWVKFETAYNTELANELGNLVQRTASMIKRYQDGEIGKMPESAHDIAPYHEAMTNYRFDNALDYIWSLIKGQNQYIENEKPWLLAKEDDPEHLREVLASVSSTILQIADLLVPFLPKSAAQIIRIFADGEISEDPKPIFPKINNHTDPSKQ